MKRNGLTISILFATGLLFTGCNTNGKVVYSKEYKSSDNIVVNEKFNPITGIWVFRYDPSKSLIAGGSFKITAHQE